MDDIYLVEIRLGTTKRRIREKIVAIARTAGIARFMEPHPHLTLFGPMTLLPGVTEEELLNTIGSVASQYNPVSFTLDRFEKREGMHGSVIAFSVHPSDSLKQLTTGIASALFPLTKSQNRWDGYPEQKWYHVTVANRLRQRKAAQVFSALLESEGAERQEHPKKDFFSKIKSRLSYLMHHRFRPPVLPVIIDETGLRITVMHGTQILAEYDLLDKCWISGNNRHDSARWQETLGRFRRYAGFEREVPQPADPGDVLLIADLHLGHANIIRYCSRPFRISDTETMDRILIKNWNARCTEKTAIYHIGDLRYGPLARLPHEYREHLGGEAVFISGNHDHPEPESVPFVVLEFEGMQFYLVHDPADAPEEFEGWVIHGHHHNNDLRNYPFIDFFHRRINVSAEVVGYVPVSLSDICETIRSRAKSGDTTPVLLNYPYTM